MADIPTHKTSILSRLCVTCGPGTRVSLEKKLRQARFAEIRFDLLEDFPTQDDVHRLIGLPRLTLATCRPGKWSDEARVKILCQAAKFGAAFVDVEDDALPSVLVPVSQAARQFGAKLILSRHDFSGVPSCQAMEAACRLAFRRGADLFKLACTVADSAALERLLTVGASEEFSGKIICVGMGAGWATHARTEAILRGMPWTYVAPNEGPLLCSGQPRLNELFTSLSERTHQREKQICENIPL